MKSFTTEQKLEFIRAWRLSGLSQEQYSASRRAEGGPSPRCLRSWMASLLKPQGLHAEVRAIVARGVYDLHELLRALDAVETVQNGESGSDDVSAEAAVPSRAATSTPASAVPNPADREVNAATVEAQDPAAARGQVVGQTRLEDGASVSALFANVDCLDGPLHLGPPVPMPQMSDRSRSSAVTVDGVADDPVVDDADRHACPMQSVAAMPDGNDQQPKMPRKKRGLFVQDFCADD